MPGRPRRARRFGSLLGLILAACSDAGTREAAIGTASPVLAAQVAMQGPALPRLRTSLPVAGAIDFPRDEWLRLEFEQDLGEGARREVALFCDGVPLGASVAWLGSRALVLNPDPALPAAAACELRWPGEDGLQRLRFATAGAGVPAFVRYDRRDSRASAPFPDDFWLRPGSDGDLRLRLAIDLSGFREPSQSLVSAFVASAQGLDGFSPIAHLTVELSEAPDVASLPRSPSESLDPLASVGLFDLTPGSPSYGARVPFRLEARSDAMGSRAPSHALLLYPSRSLTPGGRYGLVVTRRARAAAARPFEPSPFFARALASRSGAGEDPSITRIRALANDVLGAVAIAAWPPIPPEDVALAVRISVRSTREIPSDLLAIRQEIFAAPPPAVIIERVEAESLDATLAGSEVAAIVTGTWQAPDFRDAQGSLARDPVSGRPLRTRTRPVGFVLALPSRAHSGPVPVTIYQHGNPGSAEEEVVEHARRSLAAAGFAVIGFTDVVNREVSPPGTDIAQRAQLQVIDLLLHLLWHQRVPDCWVETNAEQLAFLRAIGELARVPRFELPAIGGSPAREIFGIDAAQPLTIEGVSEGASLATSLLPYAPEIRAAALIAGGRRYSEVLIHQQARVFLDQLAFLGFDDLRSTDVWVALALFQTLLDPQDPHVHAPFLWRERLGATRIEPARERAAGRGRRGRLRAEPCHGVARRGARRGGGAGAGSAAPAGPRARAPAACRQRRRRDHRRPRAVDASRCPRPRSHSRLLRAACGADCVGGTLLCPERAGILSPARCLLHVGAERRCARGRGSARELRRGWRWRRSDPSSAAPWRCSHYPGRTSSTPSTAPRSRRCASAAPIWRRAATCARWW